ncbi:hypothetical protein WMY93_029381 [Mugilogobius chulae]|uniref:Uncharacterized protein n=1 Tax=Mugilogobius chulae TaxID=88201 RepID=A0AAW0MR16_9GOBI
MDFIQQESVKIPNSVIVNEIAGDEQCDEVVELLKRYGSISRVMKVDDSTSKLHQSLIVEFNSGVAVDSIDPLPFEHVSDSGVSLKIQSLASVYTQSVGINTTKTYLTEIQNLAKMSGRDYADVLKDMMSQINDSIQELVNESSEQTDLPDNPPASPIVEPQSSVDEPSITGAQQNLTNRTANIVSSPVPSRPTIAAHDLNPPEVQRVVVEHIVKRDEYSGQHFSQKLRAFSGKEPRPSYEPDYDTWRSSVELVMTDTSMSQLQQSRKIIESLLPPAADVVRHLNPNSSPAEYLQLLDSAYGTVQDGGELFAKFLDTFQNTELGSFHCVLSQHSVTNANEPNAKTETKLNFNFGDSPISQEWKERITKQLNDMPEVFAHHDLDFGCTSKVKHSIKLHDPTPFKHRARPIHPQDLEAVRKHLQELLAAGVIRESQSPYSSPIVVVRKRNNDVRLCIDFRKLNLQTVKDSYALPNLEETFSALSGSKWFTVLDLKSGYYQIEVEEADKKDRVR